MFSTCLRVGAHSCYITKGDAVCQGMETFDSGAKFSWDHARTMRMGITGAFLVTPASFSWNLYAERIAPGTSLRAVVTKLGVSIAVLPPMVSEAKQRQEERQAQLCMGVYIRVCVCVCDCRCAGLCLLPVGGGEAIQRTSSCSDVLRSAHPKAEGSRDGTHHVSSQA